ncbi:MAG: TIGR03086 family metal-binding protein [Actinomycetota bacterium]|nr:TIGR03086 family metal-binding protein [Actinomycetota bacterium]
MNTTTDLYRRADGPLTAVLDSLSADEWEKPSPCQQWSARDVVRHVVETERDFLAGHGLDLQPVPSTDSDPAAAWRQHATAVVEVLDDDAVTGREYDGHFGRTTIGDNFARFYVFDMIVHRWDIARAAGRDERFTDTEMEQLESGIGGFGDALYMEGICKRGVEAPDGADRQTALLAALGRES